MKLAVLDRKIIAFYSPYIGAGKSTAAEYVSDTAKDAEIYSFADPVYSVVEELLTRHLNVQSVLKLAFDKAYSIAEAGGASLRDFLIAFGQAGRSVHPDLWVNVMKNKLARSNEIAVIDDLRFPNEYAMLKDKGAKIVRIINPEREIVKTETEGLLEGFEFDYELVNYKRSLEEYQAQIDKMMRELWPQS